MDGSATQPAQNTDSRQLRSHTVRPEAIFAGSRDLSGKYRSSGHKRPQRSGENNTGQSYPGDIGRPQGHGIGIRTLYIPQEVDDSSSIEFLSEIKDLPQAEREALLLIVAQLNSDPERIFPREHQPGELRKLMLARGILDAPEIIVMDEPTNHLDLHSVEALERALSAFPGALVLVSHDEQFLGHAPSAWIWPQKEEHTIGQPLL